MGLVTKEEAASLYDDSTRNARFSAIARRWAPLMWLTILWTVWIVFLKGVDPWGLYSLILLALCTLALPFFMIFYSFCSSRESQITSIKERTKTQ